jgi:hypothetical protein
MTSLPRVIAIKPINWGSVVVWGILTCGLHTIFVLPFKILRRRGH